MGPWSVQDETPPVIPCSQGLPALDGAAQVLKKTQDYYFIMKISHI